MKKALIPLDTPESPEECGDMSCEKCSIMYDTQYGAALPKCFYHEKSMLFLQMVV